MEYKELVNELARQGVIDRVIFSENLPEKFFSEWVFMGRRSLMEYIGVDVELFGDAHVIKFFRTINGERKAINVNVPYYKRKHPRKLEATSFNMFAVFEYTERPAMTTDEINMYELKGKVCEALEIICKLGDN